MDDASAKLSHHESLFPSNRPLLHRLGRFPFVSLDTHSKRAYHTRSCAALVWGPSLPFGAGAARDPYPV